jgi:hypothetical protein
MYESLVGYLPPIVIAFQPRSTSYEQWNAVEMSIG